MPVLQLNTSPRDYVCGIADCKRCLEDGGIRLLLHEQRDVLEGIVEVHAEAATHNVAAFTREVPSEADARTEAFAVIARLLGYQRSSQGAERCGSLQFLEGAACRDVRPAYKIEVLIVTEAKVHGQALAELPVVLEVNAELFRVLDDECR